MASLEGELFKGSQRVARVRYTLVKGRMGMGGILKIVENAGMPEKGALVLRTQEGEAYRVVPRPLKTPIEVGDGVPFSLGTKVDEGGAATDG